MKRLVVAAIRLYQSLTRASSGNPFLFWGFSGCRSWPTCSDYAISAVESDGVAKGMLKSAARIVRCNPFWPTQRHG